MTSFSNELVVTTEGDTVRSGVGGGGSAVVRGLPGATGFCFLARAGGVFAVTAVRGGDAGRGEAAPADKARTAAGGAGALTEAEYGR